MLDWIFEGIVTWVSSIASELMDAVSRVFLDAWGTDMDAMEGYVPFVTKAFEVMQYMAWAVLFLITVWQLLRVYRRPHHRGGEPLGGSLLRSALFALLVGAARPISYHGTGHCPGALHRSHGRCASGGGGLRLSPALRKP